MSINVVKKAERILSRNEYLEQFSATEGITKEAAKHLLERLIREPEVSEEVERFVFSECSSQDLKGYYAGEDKGFYRGHETGYAKGITLGVLATLATVAFGGATLYFKLKE